MTKKKYRKLFLDERIKNCLECPGLNRKGITENAPGYGNINSPVMIIGQSLCTACMFTQIPFTGGSGEILDKIFKKVGVRKKDIFITNLIHCHPLGNRASRPREIETCREFLIKEIEIVNPLLIVGLGLDVKTELMPNVQWNVLYHCIAGRWDGRSLLMVYHPSYYMRQFGLNGTKTMEYVNMVAYQIRRFI